MASMGGEEGARGDEYARASIGGEEEDREARRMLEVSMGGEEGAT